MTQKDFNIQEYLANGAENIIRNAIKATIKNPRESIFLTKFIKNSRKATKIRKEYARQNINIPAFLIASITNTCNLYCTGCYSRANNSCNDNKHDQQLTADDWDKIFKESSELGINFIVLAGGEPLLREDIIQKAADYPEIMFPIFTNGIMLNNKYYKTIDENRNLVPIISMEGNRQITDKRRGTGVYDIISESMKHMEDNNIIFGASITLTRNNLEYALSDEFIDNLYANGCKVLFFIEYVPVDNTLKSLTLTEVQMEQLLEKIEMLRQRKGDMLFLSFPGDEKESEGCLAAGRGFFHINSYGAAEPCPASPYSDINVKETSILQALESNLFKTLRSNQLLTDYHEGGCVLFEHENEVQDIINRNMKKE